MTDRLAGLYAITPDLAGDPLAQTDADMAERTLIDRVRQAIAGGIQALQYRDKTPDAGIRRRRAKALAAICRRANVPLIVNDDLELALEVRAQGVHLGRNDGDPASARARLGTDAIVGVSCYDSLELALAAQRAGASYVAFGSFFPSTVKPGAPRPSPDILRAARQCVGIPLVAIGGITPQNAASLIAAGADMIAVVTGLFSAPDIAAAARSYAQPFLAGDRPMEPDQ